MRYFVSWIHQRFSCHGFAANCRTASWIARTIVIVLSLVTIAVFWQVHNHEFVVWDDNVHVFDNPYLNPVTFDHILALWRAPYAHLYIPLTYTLWAMTAVVSRWITPNPTGPTPIHPQFFHSLNLLVHLLSVLVVWRITRLLLNQTIREGQHPATKPSRTRLEWAACGGVLLFAVHPLQVEAVAWVTGLKDVLCGFLSFVAIWQYLQYVRAHAEAGSSGKSARMKTHRSLWRYWLATGVFVLALLAKPAAAVVPVVAWVLDAWGWPQTWRTRKHALLVWLMVAVFWGLFTSWVQPAATVLPAVPLWVRPLIAGDTVTFYLYKLTLPIWLGPDYGRAPEVVLAQPWLWLTGLVPWGLAVWLWYKRAQVPWLVAAAGVWVASLLPVLGWVPFIFQYYSTVADRYVYVAMLGPTLALAWGLTQWHQRWLTVSCALVLGIMGMRSIWQTRYWHTTVSLFEHALTVNPHSAVAYTNLGTVLEGQQRLPEAIHHYTEALRHRPAYTQAHYNLGRVLMHQGNIQQAMYHYTEALRLQPAYAEAHNNLGMALANQGRTTEAISHYTEALRLQPENAEAHSNLGNVLASQGKTQQAIHHYTEALRLQPGFAEAHNNLGSALVNQERLDEAMQHYTEALRLRPSYARAHYNLGNVLASQGKTQQAIHHYTEALRLQPGFAEAHNNLGMVLVNQERLDEALQHYEEALKIRKNYTKAHYNLGVALAKQGRLAEARHHFAEVLRLEPNHVAARRFLESSQ
jgi:tetratricopeptide (TPR) repeat protein